MSQRQPETPIHHEVGIPNIAVIPSSYTRISICFATSTGDEVR